MKNILKIFERHFCLPTFYAREISLFHLMSTCRSDEIYGWSRASITLGSRTGLWSVGSPLWSHAYGQSTGVLRVLCVFLWVFLPRDRKILYVNHTGSVRCLCGHRTSPCGCRTGLWTTVRSVIRGHTWRVWGPVRPVSARPGSSERERNQMQVCAIWMFCREEKRWRQYASNECV